MMNDQQQPNTPSMVFSPEKELRELLDSNIPSQIGVVEESSANLEMVAAYCEGNYLQATNKQAAFDETKRMALQSLASVAYQVNAISSAVLRSLDLEAENLTEKTNEVRLLAQQLAIQKEKGARREIGKLTVNKSVVGRQNKITYPEVEDRAPRYQRTPIDFSILDDIGHGYQEPPPPTIHHHHHHSNQQQHYGSTYMAMGGLQSADGGGTLNRTGSVASSGSSNTSVGTHHYNHHHQNAHRSVNNTPIYEAGHYGHYAGASIGPGGRIPMRTGSNATLTRNATIRSSALPPMVPPSIYGTGNYGVFPGNPQQGGGGHYGAGLQLQSAPRPPMGVSAGSGGNHYDSGTLTLGGSRAGDHYGSLTSHLNGIAAVAVAQQQHQLYGTVGGNSLGGGGGSMRGTPSASSSSSASHSAVNMVGQNYHHQHQSQNGTGNGSGAPFSGVVVPPAPNSHGGSSILSAGTDAFSYIDNPPSSTEYDSQTLTRPGTTSTGGGSINNPMANREPLEQAPSTIDDDPQLPPPPSTLYGPVAMVGGGLLSNGGGAIFNNNQNPGVQQQQNSSANGWVPSEYIERTRALFDWEPQRPDELQLYPGATVYVLRKNPDGWFEGVMDGVTGLLPGNYVQPY